MSTPGGFIDSSALFDSEGQECTTWNAPVTDGALKTFIHRHNLTKDEVQPETICYHDFESYFSVKTQLISCIHGHLETTNGVAKRPATLIVLEYRFYPEEGHRFTSIHTSFTFENAAASAAGLKVFSYAPFARRQRLFQADKQTVEKNRGFSGNIGASGGLPVTAGISGDRSGKRTHVQEYFAKGTAGTIPDKTTKVNNTVWWKLQENKLQKHGVLDVFRTAVLVERNNTSDFFGRFTMEVHGTFTSFVGDIASEINPFNRRARLSDPVRFSPEKMKVQGKSDGIASGALGSLVTMEGVCLPDSYDLEKLLPEEAFIGQFAKQLN